MKKSLLFFTCILTGTLLQAQNPRIVSVNPSTNEIVIKNLGDAFIDLSEYRLCSLFDYEGYDEANVTIIEGDAMLDPDEEFTAIWSPTGGMGELGADLGLYLPTGGFGDPLNMVDFVQWETAGNGREDEAGDAGLWTAGTFVTGDVPYSYTGDGLQNGAEFWTGFVAGPTTTITINEVDADQVGTDAAEFVELYGPANEALDGLVVVMINGSDNASYGSAYDLDGFTLDANGFFVLGNDGVPNASITIPPNGVQNGADGVALFAGDGVDFPEDTPMTSENLIDFMVYDTNDDDDLELLAFLNPGQPQLNEGELGNQNGHSNSRVPDGGVQLNTDTYTQQAPTPGTTNVPACNGGTVETDNNETSVSVCVNEIEALVNVDFFTSTPESEYILVVTDEANLILDVPESFQLDFSGVEPGTCRIWGLSYTGTLDANSIMPGMDATGIFSDDCSSLSSNFIEVIRQDCTISQISFSIPTVNVEENAGVAVVQVDVFNLTQATDATITYSSGTATPTDDFTNNLPTTLNFDGIDNNPQTIEIPIVDDELEEGLETIVISLSTTTENVEVILAEMTINILANDEVFPMYTIGEVTGLDENGAADSLEVVCVLTGTVHGENLRPGGLQFTIIDETDGIGVFSNSENFGYTVTEGDIVEIEGEIDQFSGLTQIVVAGVTLISQGNPLNDPTVVTELGEATESEMTRLECVSIVDPSDWTNSGSGFNVDITDGTNTYQMRIDADVDLYGTDPIEGTFTVTGIGGQFDSSSPYDEGYQLLPRYMADILNGPLGGYSLSGDLEVNGADTCFTPLVDGSVTFSANEDDADSYSWTIGTLTSDEQSPTFDNDEFGAGTSITVTLTVERNGCTVTTEATYCLIDTGIEELDKQITFFPNPVNGIFNVTSEVVIQEMALFSINGKLIERWQVNALNIQKDISALASGLYIIQISTSEGTIFKELQKN